VSGAPTVDGQADTKIQYQPVPEYRRSGIARQEKPVCFKGGMGGGVLRVRVMSDGGV
jgi:hypothetical protein